MQDIFGYFQHYPTAWVIFVGLFSLLVGSFLNVVIYRLPIMLERDWKRECQLLFEDEGVKLPIDIPQDRFNLVFPHSHCPSCKASVKPWQNIPVLSYLLQKGKCSSCQTNISLRYPLIEILTAVAGVIAALQFGFSTETLWALLFSYLLISMCFIDFDTMLLPDQLTISLLWLGLIANLSATFVPLEDAVIGAIAGYMILWTIFQTFKLLTGKEGMGFGDFKLLAALGAWMGWQSLLVIVLLSSVVGAIAGIIILKMQDKDQQHAIPFGPYLAMAGWIAFYWQQQIVEFYMNTWVR
ncbi:type 4 prepilin-like proteins leader peptide processing enzyme [Catenovulum agarivorans DS-2]|uniref:Prepilin leader peptidase/N-methyltransferase n=1 Tax=Catenovulum agarivorans DS-2 TaxID=1328313 RepID=W7QB11_9ALTE|nr:A24 family peptidase [Catenovulum agarivorans]EWH10044.1 type 4 prepilin-like proteins leader peptide processing enzyme [Catenovulum agarivorans DS-2]